MLDILPQLLVSGLLIGGVYGLLSIGLTLIFGVLRLVNFAQCSVVGGNDTACDRISVGVGDNRCL